MARQLLIAAWARQPVAAHNHVQPVDHVHSSAGPDIAAASVSERAPAIGDGEREALHPTANRMSPVNDDAASSGASISDHQQQLGYDVGSKTSHAVAGEQLHQEEPGAAPGRVACAVMRGHVYLHCKLPEIALRVSVVLTPFQIFVSNICFK